jgi:hypothetical protein
MKAILKESIVAGVVGGAVSAVIAFLVSQNLPAPLTPFDISLGNGFSGFVSGLMSGFVGVYLVLRKGIGIAVKTPS